jgi:hypothetical protein
MTVVPSHTIRLTWPSSFLPLSCHFDIIEVIKAESPVVLNTLTERDFQDAFKKWQKHWEWCMHMGGS